MSDGDSASLIKEGRSTWHSFDAPYERLSLFSPAVIGGFALALGLGLVLVFPHSTLEERLASNNAPADRLTIEYLKAFVRAEPSASSLRVALAQRLIRLGSYAEARAALEPLRTHQETAIRVEAELLELDMLTQEAFARKAGTPERETALARARTQLQPLMRFSLTTPQLVALSHAAMALGDSASAARVFKQLAAAKAAMPVEFYAEAASTMLGMGDYRASAELYFQAMQHSRSLHDKREYFLRGLRTLQADSLFDEALRAANRHIGPLADDYETLLFLTKLARAANRPDMAEIYAKRLLKLSLMRPLYPREQYARHDRRTPLEFYFSALRGDGSQAGAPIHLQRVSLNGNEPGLPFDEEAYSLAYDVFLANRNLSDAHKLAWSAVRQRPDSSRWRKRLAEVSEWDGAPQEALEQWLAYARMTNDEAGWDAVMRLGQSQFDLTALRTALEHKLGSDPRNTAWLDKLVTLYESSGEPEEALQLLRHRLVSGGGKGVKLVPEQRRRLLELYADLALRAGRDNEALQALRDLQAEFGPNSTYALRIANLLYRRGQVSQAFAALEQGLRGARTQDADFWRAYAEVARLLQHDDAAMAGYRQLLAGDRQSEADLTNLIALLDSAQPRAAALAAEFAFDKTGNATFLIQALNYRNRVADWDDARRLLARLSAQQLSRLEKNPDFLGARAAILLVDRDVRGADRDLRAALRIKPDDPGLRANLIWTLIATRNTESLKQALNRWARDAETTPQLWGAFAAANMAINRQDVALHWFRKSGFPQDDYLWLMSYAEALDATSQPDLAWRIRRKAWQDLRKPGALAAMDPDQLQAARDQLAALAPLFSGGDETQKVMAALLRADVKKLAVTSVPAEPAQTGRELLAKLSLAESEVTADKSPQPTLQSLFKPGSGSRQRDDMRLSATVRELALAYALNRDAHDLAHAWLATRYASQLDKPLWGELSLLLAADDRDKLNRLLDELPDWLPMYDRIEAASRAGRPALAQSLAFDQLARLPSDEELHARLTNLATSEPARFQANVSQIKDAPVETTATHAESTVNLATGLRLTLGLNLNHHRNTDPTQLGVVTPRDQEAILTLRKTTDTGYVSASISRRAAAAEMTGLRLDYQLSPSSRTSLVGSMSFQQPANESALLRVGAMRSGTEHLLTYSFTRTEYGSLGVNWYRYLTQRGTVLGSGRGFSAELGTHLRMEYPNITLRAHVSRNSYEESGRYDSQIAMLVPAGSDPAGFRYLPTNATIFGLDLGLGTVAENAYSRGLRPFVELGLIYDQEQGASYNLRGGLAGSVLGQDVLMLRLQRTGVSPARPQGLQEVGLYYRWLY